MIPLVTISQEMLTFIKLHLPPLTTRAPSKFRRPSSVKFSKNIFSESQKTKYPSPSSDCMMTSSGFSPIPRMFIDSWKRCSSKLKKIIETWNIWNRSNPKLGGLFDESCDMIQLFTCKHLGIESRDRFRSSFSMLHQMSPRRMF